jgi:hypothetical protein
MWLKYASIIDICHDLLNTCTTALLMWAPSRSYAGLICLLCQWHTNIIITNNTLSHFHMQTSWSLGDGIPQHMHRYRQRSCVIGMTGGDVLSTCHDDGVAGRATTFWRAFQSCSTIESMCSIDWNIITITTFSILNGANSSSKPAWSYLRSCVLSWTCLLIVVLAGQGPRERKSPKA